MNEICVNASIAAPARASDRLVSALILAARAVERRLEEVLDTVDLSPPKYGALNQLVQAGEPLSLSELAGRLTCVRSNITQLVDRLETDGLVRRVEDPKDRRSVRAALTPLGREKQIAGARLVQQVRDEVAGKLAGVDCAAFEQALGLLK